MLGPARCEQPLDPGSDLSAREARGPKVVRRWTTSAASVAHSSASRRRPVPRCPARPGGRAPVARAARPRGRARGRPSTRRSGRGGRPRRARGASRERAALRRSWHPRRPAAARARSRRASPRVGARCSSASSAMWRYVVSLPPATVSIPPQPTRTRSRDAHRRSSRRCGAARADRRTSRARGHDPGGGSTATPASPSTRVDVRVGRHDLGGVALVGRVRRAEQEIPSHGYANVTRT